MIFRDLSHDLIQAVPLIAAGLTDQIIGVTRQTVNKRNN